MKNFFFVNNQPQQQSGEHIVHTRDCWVLPNDRKYIGRFPSFDDALEGAKEYFGNIGSCTYCLKQPK